MIRENIRENTNERKPNVLMLIPNKVDLIKIYYI